MKREVLITIRGNQRYYGQEPEAMELTTQGVLTRTKGVLCLSYAGSELTGLAGTDTVFELSAERIILRRTGRIESVMEFVVGQATSSLYTIDEGEMLVTVRAKSIVNHMQDNGGLLQMVYGISIEGEPIGEIAYDITAVPL